MKKTFIMILTLALLIMPAAGEVQAAEAGEVQAAGAGGALEDAPAEMEELLTVSEEQPESDACDGYIFSVSDLAPEKTQSKIEDAAEETAGAEVLMEKELFLADSLDTIEEIADPKDLEYIEPNYTLEPAAYEPNDTYYKDNRWYFEAVDLPYVWGQGITGKNQYDDDSPVVAVIDSGLRGSSDDSVQKKHIDYNYDNVVPGKNFSGGSISDDTNSVINHGTYVAGEIAAIMNNKRGITGFMPDAKVCPLCTFDDYGVSRVSDLITAIGYAAENDMDVANISQGTYRYSAALEDACSAAVKQGLIIVAGAGNDSSGERFYPASCSGVISVSAVDSSGKAAALSEHNDAVDVAAPGQGILCLTSFAEGVYCYRSGTSLATPFVSAAALMARSISPDITPEQFMDILKTTSVDKGDKGRDNYYGYGVINFRNIYEAVATDAGGFSAECDDFAYSGKIQKAGKSSVHVTDLSGNAVDSKYYSVKCSSPKSKVVGRYSFSVTFSGMYYGSITGCYDIVPKGTALKSVKAGKKCFSANWKKLSSAYGKQISGYLVQYSKAPDFSGAKTVKAGSAKSSLKVNNLKKNCTYYVRVAAYKNVKSKAFVSQWSDAKAVTVR